jgi:signal transduction histidine kinase
MFYHMFKRFYRVGKGNGIGLGLPLTKSVMEGQGGMLSAHNIPGGGAAFVMTFPMKLKEL